MSEQNKNLQRVARTRARLDNVDIELKKADGTKFASMAELAQSDNFGVSMYGTIDMGNFADLRFMKLSTELSEYLTISDDALVNMRKLNADKAALQANLDAVELAASNDRTAIRGELGVEEAARIAKDAEERAFALAARTLNESNRDSAIAAAKSAADQALVDAKVIADGERATDLQSMADGDAAERAFALAARTADSSARDSSIAAAKVLADQALVDAKVIADQEMADEVQDRLDGDAAERAFALAARTANETARDSSIAAAKSAADQALAAAKSVADGERATDIQDMIDRDAAERAFALAARAANETARDSAISAAKQVADSEMAQVVGDLASYEVFNDAAVQVERGRLDALLAGSDVDLNQLVELVAAYELADTDIISSITNEIADRTQGDADERAFALAARTADSAQRDQEIATAKATSDQEIAAAKVVADGEMAQEQSDRAQGDADERAFALAARTANETARDSSIAAAKSAADQALAAAKVVADGEMADEVQDRLDGDAAERAFALAARTANETARDSAISAAKQVADQALVDAKVIADQEMADEVQDRLDGDAAERAFALQARVDQLAAINGDVVTNDTFGKVEDAMDVDRAAAISYTNAETTRAQNAEGTLDTKVDTEIADRIQAVQDLHNIIDADMLSEQTVRAANDQLNAANLLAEQQATSTDRAAIRSELAAADGVERQFALDARTLNESNRDSSIAAAKVLADQALVDAKVIADGERTADNQALVDGDAAERAFALAARQADSATRDQEIAAAKSAADQALAAAKSVADAEMAQVVGDLSAYELSNDAAVNVERLRIDAILEGSSLNLDQLIELVQAYEGADTNIITTITTDRQSRIDGDSAERAFALAARAANETARDSSIAAAKVLADQALVDAKVIADGERATDLQSLADGDAAERAFALAARILNESNRDSSIAAAKSAADQALVDAKVIADAEMTQVVGDLASYESSNDAALSAEISLARAEEAKLAADVLALHGRHDEYEQVMTSDFEAGAFSLASAAFNAPMSDIMGVHVNGFKLMSDEFTVSKVEGAMSSIVFHVPMYIGDAVSVSGMKKITLQS
jgi:hypothetical protein